MSDGTFIAQPWVEDRPLFVSGEGDYHTYRIPALAITGNGTLLAFAEGRKHGRSDAGEIDLILRRLDLDGSLAIFIVPDNVDLFGFVIRFHRDAQPKRVLQ